MANAILITSKVNCMNVKLCADKTTVPGKKRFLVFFGGGGQISRTNYKLNIDGKLSLYCIIKHCTGSYINDAPTVCLQDRIADCPVGCRHIGRSRATVP